MRATYEADEIATPRGLSPAERATFRRVVRVRCEDENWISGGEIDIIVDYARARSRLDQLSKILQDPELSRNERLRIGRAIDATTALAQKIAKTLLLPH